MCSFHRASMYTNIPAQQVRNVIQTKDLFPTCFMLVFYLAYFSTLKMKATCSLLFLLTSNVLHSIISQNTEFWMLSVVWLLFGIHNALNLGCYAAFRLLIFWIPEIFSNLAIRLIKKKTASLRLLSREIKVNWKANGSNGISHLKICSHVVICQINLSKWTVANKFCYIKLFTGSSNVRVIILFLIYLLTVANNFNNILLQPRLVDTLMTAEKHSHYQNSVNCFRKLLGKLWKFFFSSCSCRIS